MDTGLESVIQSALQGWEEWLSLCKESIEVHMCVETVQKQGNY